MAVGLNSKLPVMMSRMLSARHDDQIVERVIQFISVDVVNHFGRAQTTLQVALHYAAMFKHPMATFRYAMVSVAGYVSSPVLCATKWCERIAVLHESKVMIRTPTTTLGAFTTAINCAVGDRSLRRICSCQGISSPTPHFVMSATPSTTLGLP